MGECWGVMIDQMDYSVHARTCVLRRSSTKPFQGRRRTTVILLHYDLASHSHNKKPFFFCFFFGLVLFLPSSRPAAWTRSSPPRNHSIRHSNIVSVTISLLSRTLACWFPFLGILSVVDQLGAWHPYILTTNSPCLQQAPHEVSAAPTTTTTTTTANTRHEKKGSAKGGQGPEGSVAFLSHRRATVGLRATVADVH